MGGLVEELNPVKGLKKLGNSSYEYRLLIEGKHEDSELLLDVKGFPTTGEYHIEFTAVKGLDSTHLKDWLEYDLLIFKTDTIDMNMDNGTVTILLSEPDSNFNYYLENIKAVIRMPREEIEVSLEDVMNNKHYKAAMFPKKPSILSLIKSIFTK